MKCWIFYSNFLYRNRYKNNMVEYLQNVKNLKKNNKKEK